MSEYICRGCDNNNHGWCRERKIQVKEMKGKTQCSYRPNIPDVATLDFDGISREIQLSNLGRPNTLYWTAMEQESFFRNHPEVQEFALTDSYFNSAIRSLTSGMNMETLVMTLYLSYKTNADLHEELLKKMNNKTY